MTQCASGFRNGVLTARTRGGICAAARRRQRWSAPPAAGEARAVAPAVRRLSHERHAAEFRSAWQPGGAGGAGRGTRRPAERGPARQRAGAAGTDRACLRDGVPGAAGPGAVAALPPERLIWRWSELLEIATERRFQLNAREQHPLAGELVDDMLGLGPLEQLLEDDSIADIMVNGPNRSSSKRAARSTLSQRAFPRHGAPDQHLPAHRRRGRTPHR